MGKGGGGSSLLVRFEVSVMIMHWLRKFYFAQIYDLNSKHYFCYELVTCKYPVTLQSV